MRTITNKQAVEIKSLSLTRSGASVLENVNLTIKPGEHVALLGANGSGKSTLLEVILGILKPESGHIDRPQKVAFVPQRGSLSENVPITVKDVVGMGRWADLKKWQRVGKKDEEIIAHNMKRLRIEGLANRQLAELSGGQRQRTFIARALSQEADLLMLDEPESGLDADAAEIIGSVLAEEAARGIIVVIATHDLGSAKRAKRCVVLSAKEHRIVADGPPTEILNDRLVARTFA